MTIDELNKLLEEGTITQEQFTIMADMISPNDAAEPEQPTREADGTEEAGNDPQPDIEQLIQRAVDRATNKLGNENKKLRGQLENIRKTKLTEAEAAELERKEREAELEERERALLEKENRLYAIRAIKTAGLDDGSSTALELVDFVMSQDQNEIDGKVKAFGQLIKRFVQAEVDRTFKANGRTPQAGNPAAKGNNPYAKETMNITEQMALELKDPALAKQLRAAAGN